MWMEAMFISTAPSVKSNSMAFVNTEKKIADESSRSYLIPFILVTSLFFLWAFVHNLEPILIPHLKKACQLSDLQSALIDSSVYIGYFVMALQAGLFMKKYGYKKG